MLSYLVIKTSIYIILLIIGLWMYFKRRYKEDLYITLAMILALLYDLLDHTIISSNLELSAVYDVCFMFILVLLAKEFRVKKSIRYGVLVFMIFTAFLAFYMDDFGWTNSSPVFTSNYGYMTTDESVDLSILNSIVISSFMFYCIWVLVSNPNIQSASKGIIICFAFIVLYATELGYSLLVRHLYTELDSFRSISITTIYVRVMVSYLVLSIGVLWKK